MSPRLIACGSCGRIRRAWIIEQEVGRGERLISGDPDADNIVIEPFYNGDHHAMGVLDLFRTPVALNGGFLADSCQPAST